MKFKLVIFLEVLLLLIVAFCIGFFITQINVPSGGAYVLIASVGLLVLLFCFINPKIGLILSFIISYFISVVYRLFIGVNVPLGTGVEIIILVSFFGVFLRKLSQRNHDWSFVKSPITYVLIFLLLFNCIEFVNPFHFNPAVTFILVKRQLCMLLFYVICLYLFQEKKFVFTTMNWWIGLSVLVALYACSQEWFGFLPFELKWLYSSEDILRLFYIGGKFRKYSILNNPTIMGIMMSMSAIFLITLLMGKFSLSKKAWMSVMILLMLLAVGFSGTRTAYAMIAGGFFLLILMNIHKRTTIVLAICGAVLFAGIMYGPYTNSTILRVRSAFYPENDASYNVRDLNRASIQPFIYAHPIGAGLGTSGATGKSANPGQRLAGFPPDSEYLKSALETGYIGYFFLLLGYFIILNTMINKFFKLESEQLKIYYSALIVTIFSLFIANYAQETAGMLPNDVIFYLLFAFGASIYKFDINFDKKTHYEK